MTGDALATRCAAHLRALAGIPAPLAYVDLDALDRNAARLAAQADGVPVRIASKSLRCTRLVLDLAGRAPAFSGVMAFTAQEALHLARAGADDLLIAYPCAEPAPLAALAAHRRSHPEQLIRPIVDDLAQARAIAAAAREAGVRIPVCVDVDAGWRPLPIGPTIGPKRSPLHTPREVAAFVRALGELPELRVDALMAYDGQIAGVADRPAGRPLRGRAVRVMQRGSLRDLGRRVPAVVEAARGALAERGESLAVVNVGGTGSLARMRGTGGATELAAGSGFYAPALFDDYAGLALEPAAFFVLPVVRRPSARVATVLGGGYPASGAAGADRLPRPVHPPGLRLDPQEGAGEVQTPLLGPGARGLRIGDRVVFRHAKAGELAERFDALQLLRDGAPVETAATYRGEGHTFL